MPERSQVKTTTVNRIFYDVQATQGAGGNGEIPEEEFKRIADQAYLNNFYTAKGQNKGFETGYKMGASHEYRRHLPPSPSLPGEQDPAPKLADTIKWMSEAARRNLKNCETNLLEAHYEGYLEALEELGKELELTPSDPQDPDGSASYEKWLDQPGLERMEQVDPPKE